MKNKKINLQKSSLLKLQDEQMKALIGAEGDQTVDSGVACDNTVKPAVARLVEDSCCRRSCNKS
jgi:natural product precursor